MVKEVIDIERLLVWAYRDQAVNTAANRSAARGRPMGYGSVFNAVASRAALGVAIDCSGSAAWDSGRVHPDADAVHTVVCSTGIDVGLVIMHARADTRPDWLPCVTPILIPVLNRRGKPTVVQDKNKNPVYCPVRIHPDPKHIRFKRVRYVTWWDCLDTLAQTLVGSLTRYEVTGPAVAREPWGLDKT